MTRDHLRPTQPTRLRLTGTIPLILALAMTAPQTAAQTEEWRLADNPYQEDVEYTIGTTFNPRVAVEGVRWRSFIVESPERGSLMEGETASTRLVVQFENRRTTSARILVILLLEDADGSPLDRIEVRPFKVAGGRLKERTETVELLGSVIDSTERVYLFFEVMQ